MINLHKVTLLTIDGTGKNTNKVKNLFDISSKDISYSDKIIITADKDFKNYEDVTVINIEPLTYKGYNRFCILELTKYVNSDYVLLVQNDGFPTNPNLWTDEFLNYDYIGAPWYCKDGRTPFPWTDGGTKNLVGCGGFTIRSKRLLQLCSMYDSNFVDGQISGGMHEDIFVCVYGRPYLEQNGCRFPSVELADLFSCGNELFEAGATQKSFGFHGSKDYIQDALNYHNKKHSTDYSIGDVY